MAFSQGLVEPAEERAAEAKPDRDRKERAKSAPTTTNGPKGNLRAGGLVLVVVGALLWLAGARYTLVGWHVGLNWFFGWLGVPARLPALSGYAVLLAVPLGVIYSLIELRRPWTVRARDWQTIALYAVVWIVVVVSDGGTTFLGVKQGGSMTIAQQVAASDGLAAVWAMVLTFLPEWFILGGISLLRR